MKKVHVYSHTHWDYEWYFTANETIVQLIYHMDEVIDALETGKVDNYLLDGQLSILDEYIKFMPSKFECIKKLVKEKKLIIGPWYTQTDELIIRGESIVRNLFYGIKSANKYGEAMKIGYLPDSFGQTKDLPKILNGFGIKYSIFWRGVSEDKCTDREFRWKSEDGSEVIVYNIKDGYYYGGNLIYSDDVKVVEETILKGSATDNILLPLGGDQRYVDFNVKERIDFYNKNTQNKFQYVENSCEEFFKELEKENNLKEVQGEFIDPSNSKIHRSIYSSRYDHKYLNDKIERRMIKVLEPLMVLAQNLGLKPKQEMLEEIWKKLLMNHAHDSACGCNSDKTNDHIISRFKEVDELSYSACDYIIRKVSESLKNKEENEIILFNVLAKRKSNPIKIEITSKVEGFYILNEEGKEVDFQIIEQRKHYSGSIKRKKEDEEKDLYFYTTKVWIKEEINPFSIKRLKVIEGKRMIEETSKEINKIEDDFFIIEFKEGKLSLYDKKQNKLTDNFIYIEDSGDDGDTYDYSPPRKDFKLKLDFNDAKISCKNKKIVSSMELNGSFNIPNNLEDREKKRCNVQIPYELQIILKNNELIEFKLELENNAESHRMRAIIETKIKGKTSITDTPFGIIERENKPKHLGDWKELKWKEEPSPIYPMLTFANINNNEKSVTVFSKGIKEFEILDDSNIALTLFRGVGYLGKPDLVRRPGIASGNEFKYIETPKSQLKEKLKFKFAIYKENSFNVDKVQNKYDEYSVWIPYYQIQSANRFTNTLKYFVSHPLKEEIEIKDKVIDCSLVKGVAVTAIMPISNNEYIIRLNNLGEEIIDSGKIMLNSGKEYVIVNLNNEEIEKRKKVEKEIFVGKFKKGEIKTIKVIL